MIILSPSPSPRSTGTLGLGLFCPSRLSERLFPLSLHRTDETRKLLIIPDFFALSLVFPLLRSPFFFFEILLPMNFASIVRF